MVKLSFQQKPYILNSYINGNSKVTIWSDGTKERVTEDDEFKPEFPENIDLKITNRCTGTNCTYCHEDSGPEGIHGDLNFKFIDSLIPGTELAIGGGNVLEHPGLEHLLAKLRDKGIIANITINQYHLSKNINIINEYQKNNLIKGLGISLMSPDRLDEDLSKLYNKDNVVIHIIAGIHNINKLKNKNLKVLILGYKDLRRGHNLLENYETLITTKIKETERLLKEQNYLNYFRVLSFDNLALEQLNVKEMVSEETWKNYYMGDDGRFTMYIDLPNKEFASSSTSLKRYKIDTLTDIKDIFKIILSE